MRLLFSCTVLAVLLCCGAELPCTPKCQTDTGNCTADHGVLQCQCIGNWSGDTCSTFICDRENPCQNGGVCSQHPANLSQFLCSCPIGFTGPRCEYRTHGSACNVDRCGVNGTCYVNASDEASFVCVCNPGNWGVLCEYLNSINPDPCQEDRCHGRGTCRHTQSFADPNRNYECICDGDYNPSTFCRLPNGFDTCSPNPCYAGSCVVMYATLLDYVCTCPPTHTGVNCSVPFNVCINNTCRNGGTCNPILEGHYYNCSCPPNYSGYYCESIIDPCVGTTCQNGGSCQPATPPDENGLYSSSSTVCVCPCGYDGNFCENPQSECPSNYCQNGGTCSSSPRGPSCLCPPGFTGQYCQATNHCASDPCGVRSDRCVNLPQEDSFVCVCEDGWAGQACATDLNECSKNPCVRGTCENTEGGYTCNCDLGFTGQRCELLVDCSTLICGNGGTCEAGGGQGGSNQSSAVCLCPPSFTGVLCESPVCPLEHCADVANNGECDSECFTDECGYDGAEGVCFTPNGTNPWVDCSQPEGCRSKFNNGQCDVGCNVPECLYDAGECMPENSCPAEMLSSCERQVSNGVCNLDCNTPRCPYDYLDCRSQRYANNLLVLILITPASRPFAPPYSTIFLRELGRLLKSIPVVISNITLSPSDLDKLGYALSLYPTDFGDQIIIYQVVIRLDIEFCKDQCPTTAEDAVAIVQAYYSTGKTTIAGYSISDAYAQPDEPNQGTPTTWYYVGGAACLVLLAAVALAIMIGIKRKRISAKVWRPPSPASESDHTSSSTSSDRRRTSQAGAMIGTEAASITHSDSNDYIAKGSKAAKMDGGGASVRWSDLQVPVDDSSSAASSTTAVIGQTGHDARQWNSLHYEAMRNPKFVKQLVEVYRQQNGHSLDVNATGPGGYTPLMIAVSKRLSSHESLSLPSRSSSESSGDFGELVALLPQRTKGRRVVNSARPISSSSSGSDTSSSGSVHGMSAPLPAIESSVGALIDAHADLNATNDFGQTALHLAAGCSRGDYVEMLLEAGANPNLQDNWGQSSLQAAIGAAAEGAFMVILNHPKADLNLKSDGGITPLMAAVKVVNQFMVKQLLKKSVDIAACDNEGRTAVHWAAVVDNLEALKLLIRQGPDTLKDAQDNKGQTALFLACREGCASCVKHLLDCFANVTLLDNLDRSPIQIAYEKQHHDIVELLKTSAHGPLVHYPLPSRVHSRMPMYSHGPGMGISADQEVFVMQRPPSSLVRTKRQAKQPQERSAVTETAVPYPYPTDIRGHQFYHQQQQQQQHELAASYLGTHTTQPAHQTFGELTHQPTSVPLCHPSKIPLQDMHTYSYSSSVNGAVHPTSSHMTHLPSSSSSSSSSSQPQLLNTPKVHPTVTSGYNGKVNYGTSYSNNGSGILLESSHLPTTSGYSSAIQQTLPASEPMATTSSYTEPTASLSDIETVNELITSMADDLGPVPHHTTATAIDPSQETVLQVNGSKTYDTQSVDQLQSVGYSMPSTTTIVGATQPSGYTESSGGYTHVSDSYHQTVYDCCTQSAPSSSSYHDSTQPSTGSTIRLQHLPMPVDMPDPSLQYAGGIIPNNPGTYGHHQNGTTGVGNNSRSPPSYYPSPPSTTDLQYGVPPPVGHPHSSIDPPSLTPSPESRDELRQCMDQFTTESYVEGQIQDYPLHLHQHFVTHRPVPPCESHV